MCDNFVHVYNVFSPDLPSKLLLFNFSLSSNDFPSQFHVFYFIKSAEWILYFFLKLQLFNIVQKGNLSLDSVSSPRPHIFLEYFFSFWYYRIFKMILYFSHLNFADRHFFRKKGRKKEEKLVSLRETRDCCLESKTCRLPMFVALGKFFPIPLKE